MRTETNRLQADTSYSTYWWNIYLDETQKVPLMRGYSKFIGHEERQNKLDLLKVKIEMFRKHGYLNKIKHIEIYRRAANIIQLDKDIHILTLYPTHFEFKDVLCPEYRGCSRYISDLYEIHKGNDVVKLQNLNFKRSDIKKDDMIDPQKRKNEFRTLDQLINEVNRMQSSGYAPEQVKHFYNSIIEKNQHLK